ncbi:MAG TPA: PilZ domain-containing protein [Deltaproteobacteria bacterium]|jgi:c-di-GMP-binding flagellar brake protein YcgR|nr:PilZ domain-containing protein [Deltaproteobacteria bacterium]HIJ75413.1 PilZ domain-containing protein [Deltaproteobacteria bacterium]
MEELMRFDGAAKKMAGNQLHREAKERDPLVDADVHTRIRIPFRIDDALMVRSLTYSAQMARTRIIGAMHGKYILIIEPSAKINDRISVTFDGDFLCSYFNNGFMHIFHSRYLKHLTEDVVCIDYPTKVEVHQIRKYRRIRVNIETECTVCGTADVFYAKMADISQGGCRLILNESARIVKGTNLSLTFNLPNEAFVSGLQTKVAGINGTEDSKATELGVAFSGPESELSKLSNFCEYCMYFDLEEPPRQV